MDFNEYQELAFSTATYPNKLNNPYYPVMGLGGEAGEVLNKVKKIMRDDNGVISQQKRQEVKDELGDCAWYLAVTAKEFGLLLDDVVESNIAKLAARKERNVIKGSGDYR